MILILDRENLQLRKRALTKNLLRKHASCYVKDSALLVKAMMTMKVQNLTVVLGRRISLKNYPRNCPYASGFKGIKESQVSRRIQS